MLTIITEITVPHEDSGSGSFATIEHCISSNNFVDNPNNPNNPTSKDVRIHGWTWNRWPQMRLRLFEGARLLEELSKDNIEDSSARTPSELTLWLQEKGGEDLSSLIKNAWAKSGKITHNVVGANSLDYPQQQHLGISSNNIGNSSSNTPSKSSTGNKALSKTNSHSNSQRGSVDDLFVQIKKGESSLQFYGRKNGTPLLVRTANIMRVEVSNVDDHKILFNTREKMPTSNTSHTENSTTLENWVDKHALLSVQLTEDEATIISKGQDNSSTNGINPVQMLVSNALKKRFEFVSSEESDSEGKMETTTTQNKIKQHPILSVDEVQYLSHSYEVEESQTFPGLLTIYHLHTVKATQVGLPSNGFNSFHQGSDVIFRGASSKTNNPTASPTNRRANARTPRNDVTNTNTPRTPTNFPNSINPNASDTITSEWRWLAYSQAIDLLRRRAHRVEGAEFVGKKAAVRNVSFAERISKEVSHIESAFANLKLAGKESHVVLEMLMKLKKEARSEVETARGMLAEASKLPPDVLQSAVSVSRNANIPGNSAFNQSGSPSNGGVKLNQNNNNSNPIANGLTNGHSNTNNRTLGATVIEDPAEAKLAVDLRNLQEMVDNFQKNSESKIPFDDAVVITTPSGTDLVAQPKVVKIGKKKNNSIPENRIASNDCEIKISNSIGNPHDIGVIPPHPAQFVQQKPNGINSASNSPSPKKKIVTKISNLSEITPREPLINHSHLGGQMNGFPSHQNAQNSHNVMNSSTNYLPPPSIKSEVERVTSKERTHSDFGNSSKLLLGSDTGFLNNNLNTAPVFGSNGQSSVIRNNSIGSKKVRGRADSKGSKLSSNGTSKVNFVSNKMLSKSGPE